MMTNEQALHDTVEKLQQQVEMLQQRVQGVLFWGGLVTWAYDVERAVFEVDNDFFAYYDLDVEPPFSIETVLTLLHHEDRELFATRFGDLFAGKTVAVDVSYRFRTKSGEWIWFNGRGGVTKRAADGTPLFAAGTLQNVAEIKNTELAIQRRDRLLSASTEAARVLLEDVGDNHEVQIRLVLELLGAATRVDRVYIWKNYYGADGRQYTTQIHEWSVGVEPQQGNELCVDRPVEEAIPTWEKIFREGKCVNNLVRLMPPVEREQLTPQGIVSILVAPIMFKDEFWGFIGFDDCQKERIWSDSEVGILKSAGMIVAAAIMRQQAEKELIEARNLAEAGTKAKSEFLARMSHEIRTPMNAILGMTSLCLQTAVTEQQRDYLQKTQTASTNLLGIIDDILDFSKIEAGKILLESIPIRLSRVMQDVIDVVDMKAHDKGLQFVTQIDASVHDDLLGDPLRVRQILTNLINNAIKFTERGSVSVTVHSVDNEETQIEDKQTWLHFAVRDSGIGMTEEELGQLFQSFSQADGSTTRKFGGTGLGLAISKRFVELMGGRIWAESKPGIGSTFHFRIPFTKYTPIQQNDLNAMSRRQAKSLDNCRILVVDDDEAVRLVFCDWIRPLAAHVEAVGSGHAALSALMLATQDKKPFDVALLDWKMPRMNGLETIRRMRARNDIVLPRMIMISAYDRAECVRQTRELGLDAILSKPVTKRQLEETLKAAIQNIGVDATTLEETKPVDLTGAKILLAEDNKINQLVASALLKGFGVELTIAADGVQAVDAVSRQHFDLVLMDIQMPNMDGYEATQEIRRLPKPGMDSLPILAMTANALDSDFQACIEVGMNDHLAKPIDVKKLRGALETWIAR